HTDYGGGRVLVGAVDRGVAVQAQKAAGAPGSLAAASEAYPGTLQLRAGTDPQLPPGHWGRYAQTVLDRLTDNFGPLRPARLAVAPAPPPASGTRSPSATSTGTAMALAALNGRPATGAWAGQIPDRVAPAGYAASNENGKSFGTLRGRP